jgi:hypothetical protein
VRADKSYRYYYSSKQANFIGSFLYYELGGVLHKVTELKSSSSPSGWSDAKYLGSFQKAKFIKKVTLPK